MLLSGCFKNDTTMKINKDKSMNLEVTLTVEDQYKSTLSSNFDSADIEKRGFKVTTINNDDYSGYKITKKYNNIDELSKSDNKPLEISNILDSDFASITLILQKTVLDIDEELLFSEIENIFIFLSFPPEINNFPEGEKSTDLTGDV